MSENIETMDGDVHAHISPNTMYFTVFAALAVLTVLTWAIALYDLGPFNDVVALGIAATKTTLVVLYFMHVLDAPKLTKLVVASSVIWLLIMFGLTMIDYTTRQGVVRDPEPVPPAIEYDFPSVSEGAAEH